jgi:sugar O-acyltransferase (sialic acid O-acetyltransferase NeuD family)
MQDLIILGTGVHGAEMAHIVERINRQHPTWRLIGHIAPRPTQQTTFAGHPVLGTLEALAAFPDAALVADNEFPKDLPIPEERLISLIDPGSYVHPTAQIGRGCVIYPNCFVGFNAVLGQRVFMLSGCIVNHDNRIEDRVVFASGVTLAGCVHVEEGAYLGQSCTVRQHLRIGRNSLIGMGAVVVKEVPPQVVMAGNPARKLRDK